MLEFDASSEHVHGFFVSWTHLDHPITIDLYVIMVSEGGLDGLDSWKSPNEKGLLRKGGAPTLNHPNHQLSYQIISWSMAWLLGFFSSGHFAGPVTYQCINFLDKNKDQGPDHSFDQFVITKIPRNKKHLQDEPYKYGYNHHQLHIYKTIYRGLDRGPYSCWNFQLLNIQAMTRLVSGIGWPMIGMTA